MIHWPHRRDRSAPPSAALDIVHEDEDTDAQPVPLTDDEMAERG